MTRVADGGTFKIDALLRRQDVDRYDDRLLVRTNIVEAYLRLMEFIERRRLSNSRALTALFAVAAIFATAAIYEIFEFVYAVMADPAAGIAVLGSQGDVWDAQKDMLADGLGSIAAALFYLAWYRKPPLPQLLKEPSDSSG